LKKSRILFLSIVFLFITINLYSENLSCNYCNSQIEGKYFSFNIDGNSINICETCLKNSKKCSLCNIPVKNYKKIDNLILCKNCNIKYSKLPVCSYCKKKIIGKAQKFRKKNIWICNDCFKTASKCKLCKIPLGLKGDNEDYCSSCIQTVKKSKSCYHCNKKLLGKYVEYTINNNEKKYICLSCKNKYEKCYLCGFPSRYLENVDSEKVCYDCLKKVDKCRNCGKYCLKRYDFILSKFVYCDNCVKNYSSCSSCGAPTNGVLPLEDGRVVCDDCIANCVKNITEVKEIFFEIKKMIEKALKIKVREIKKIRFADRNQMIKLSKNLDGITDTRLESYPSGLFQRKGEIYNIFVLPYLRKDILKGVIAHEFAHAFLAEYHPNNQNLEEVEGFCEWVRYKVLKKYKDKAGIKNMKKRKDFYGKAFRKIYKIDKQQGYKKVFEYIARFD
jgi:hypothetical protein